MRCIYLQTHIGQISSQTPIMRGKNQGLSGCLPEFATEKSSEASQYMGFHCFFA